jgi:uncharacterized protein (DUF934 family)
MVDSIRLRDDDVHEEPAVSLDSFLDQSNATAVRIEAGEDARQLLPFLDRLSLIEIDFPVFGDGRGYSAAQILREAGYTGELRASGDVLLDQLAYMRRCGFDAFAPDSPINAELMQQADQCTPIWRLRHG